MELNKKWCKSRETELLYRGKKEKEKRLNMLPLYVHYPQKKKKKKKDLLFSFTGSHTILANYQLLISLV